jgi:hypothetical protein
MQLLALVLMNNNDVRIINVMWVLKSIYWYKTK